MYIVVGTKNGRLVVHPRSQSGERGQTSGPPLPVCGGLVVVRSRWVILVGLLVVRGLAPDSGGRVLRLAPGVLRDIGGFSVLQWGVGGETKGRSCGSQTRLKTRKGAL